MKILDTTRAEYNKLKKKRTTCFFCDSSIIEAQNCTNFVYEHWIVLVNKHPYQNGNVMLVPKKHKTKLSQLSKAEWTEFSEAIVEVQSALNKNFKTNSYNICLNEGKASGRSVSHLHWQIIPRWFKNHTVVDIMADIQAITLNPKDLKALLSKK